jgi:putative ABC transport system ATP-binding protein
MIPTNENLMAIFETMAQQLGVHYERVEVRQLIAAGEVAGVDPLGALYRVAERYRIRLGVFDGTLSEALAFAGQDYPVAIAPPPLLAPEVNPPVDSPARRWLEQDDLAGQERVIEQAGAAQWWVLLSARRRSVKAWSTSPGAEPTWIGLSQLRQTLGLKHKPDAILRLVVAQPLDALQHSEHSQKPLTRLLHLMRPDRKDIYALIVFSIVVGILGLATPLAVESLVNTVAFNRYLQPVIILAILLFTFLSFAAMLSAVIAIQVDVILRRLFVRIGLDTGHRLSNADLTKLDNRSGPELVNRFLDIAIVQKTIASMLLEGIAMVIAIVIGMIVLAIYHPFLLGFDIVLLLLMAFMVFGLGGGGVKTAIKESKAKYHMQAWLEDIIACPTAFQLGGGLFAMDRTDQLLAQWLGYRKAHFSVLLRQIIFALSVYVVASVSLLTIGGFLVINNQLTLGQLVAAELIVTVIVGAFAKMGKQLEAFYDLMAAVGKVGDVLDLAEVRMGGRDLLRTEGPLELEIRNLAVAAAGKTVITDFNATLTAGNSVAVVGPPGSGKSLLLETLATLRQPKSGSIRVNQVDLRQLDHAQYCELIGYCRGVEIFAGTVAENIHLHRPGVDAVDVQEALEFVGLSEEIGKLEAGVDCELAPGGRPLSATQAARLMIARAIVTRPPLLIIDALLDALPKSSGDELISRLHTRIMPWSLIVATSRSDWTDSFVEKWVLSER